MARILKDNSFGKVTEGSGTAINSRGQKSVYYAVSAHMQYVQPPNILIAIPNKVVSVHQDSSFVLKFDFIKI